ncbi:MAG: hypothetical protein NBV68_13255 [Erythrobacter sp.]|uniref:hypothetical protein n=1 Tax=Erythrobacter sp. TaxID=1042 RepID=UPI0025D6B349|nr:hypothetical protein [Erythrobacter sp.]MCM0000346.1 hypothetical protein [Erythrobacter sp.]
MTSKLPLLALALLIVPQTAVAQSSNAQLAEQRFRAADKNADSKLTREEAKAGMPRIHRNFDRVDANKDGFVTLAEIKAMMAAAGQ